MNYASYNFTMDIVLMCLALAFLIREYPLRTAVLTILCIVSYLVPLSRIENALMPPSAHPLVSEESVEPMPTDTSDPAAAAREQVRQMAQGDPSQATRNVTGIWTTVLNGLSGMPGASGPGTAPVNVDQMVAEHNGMAPTESGKTQSVLGIQMGNLEKSLLEGRFGHNILRKREAVMVEQFWFFARCCLLAGAAYFLLFDWKITMSIVSLCVIPVHYYMVLFMFLGVNWKKTEPWWGTLQAIGIGALVLVLLAIIGRQILLHTDKHSFHIPNPEHYRARLGGIDYDYVIIGNSLELAGITLDLANSYLDDKNRALLRFQSGAAIEFVARQPVS